MNYKELIGTLRRFSAYYPINGPIEKEAADAIETLIEERDAALRAKQTAVKLDRSRWEGCEWCNKYGLVVAAFDGWSYCNRCGKPLTKEAWAELERRINDGTTD